MSPFADLGSPASFQRLVDHQLQAAAGFHKGFHDQIQQLATHCQWRPARSVEYLVERAEVRLPFLASRTQGGGNSAASMGKPRPSQQRHHFSKGSER
jgi:hypothetical protein